MAHRIVAAWLVVGALLGACTADERVTCATTVGTTTAVEVPVGPLAPLAAGTAHLHEPPCVDPSTARVVILFHGGGLGPQSWWEPPVDALTRIDRLTVDGEIGPALFVLPAGSDGGHFYAEHALEPLLATIDERRGQPVEQLTLAGFSAGALTAGEVLVLDGAPPVDRLGLFGTIWSNGLNRDLAGHDAASDLQILADTGEDDGGGELFVPGIAEAAASAGIEMTVQRHPGGHDLVFVASRLDDWLRWLAPPG